MPKFCKRCRCPLPPDSKTEHCQLHDPDQIAARKAEQAARAAQFREVMKRHGLGGQP